MADPTKYNPTYSYSNWQATRPTKPLPAPQVDNDLANISTSINQAIEAIKDVRRSDGRLKNGIVTTDSLAPQLSLGFSLEGQWQVGTTYDPGDGVVFNSIFYKAAVGHKATVDNSPPNSAFWTFLFSVDDLAVAGALSMPVNSFVGDGVTLTFALSFTPVSYLNLIVSVGGLPQATSEYTTAGNSIVFDVAPPNGYAIEVRGFATTATLVTPVDGSVSYNKLDAANKQAVDKAITAIQYGDLGNAAFRNVGTAASTVAAGNDSRILNAATLLAGMVVANPYSVPSRRFVSIAFQAFVSNALDADYPTLGPAAIWGRGSGNLHGLQGEALQNNAVGDYSFPCAVVANAVLRSAGNTVFGLFARAEQWTPGVITHELNTFNYYADAPSTYPYSRAFGVTAAIPVGLTVAAGGTYASAAGIEIGSEGSVPNKFQFGIALYKAGIKQWSYYQDADATDGPNSGMYMAIPGAGIHMVLRTMGTAAGKNRVLQVVNASGAERAAITQDGTAYLGSGAGNYVLSRLAVAGNATVKGLANVVATFGVELLADSTIGASVLVGSVNGVGPFIAGSRYGTADGTAATLSFFTDNTERFRLLASTGNGLNLFTPVPANSYANDTAAKTAGVPVGGWYRNGSVIQMVVA